MIAAASRRCAWALGELIGLPDHYREIVVLRHSEGISFDEIARRMEKSVSAVRALWLRALDRLRRTASEDNPT